MQDLGVLPGAPRSEAYGINERGDIVGRSGFHAFLYTDGQMWNLNDLVDMPEGWRLEMATEINDLGQIVGYAVQKTSTGMERAFLLTSSLSNQLLQLAAADTVPGESLAGTFSARYYPVPLSEPVPEPAAGALLLMASAAALLRRHCRHD